MSQLVLSRGVSRKNIFQKVLSNIEFGAYFLVVSLVLFVVLVTIITLIFSTQQVTKGYVLTQLEMEHKALLREGEIAEKQVAEVASLRYIESSSMVGSMRRPSNVVFINSDSAIASR